MRAKALVGYTTDRELAATRLTLPRRQRIALCLILA